MQNSRRTKIKICGLFRREDICYVNEAKPDYIGFVFAESRRRIGEEDARRLRIQLDPSIQPVGVFVNAPIDTIARLYDHNIISIAQLHGEEDAAYIAALKERAAVPVIKTIKVTESPRVPESSEIDFLMFDSGSGSGQCFDWKQYQQLAPAGRSCFLAGGINRDNIAAALALAPYAIDISSGAESGGLKDRDKILELVRLMGVVA